MGKTAIILGITGVTGTALAHQLFEDAAYRKVISFHRRKSGLVNAKLEEYIIDPAQLNSKAPPTPADVVFCCVGTTMATAGSKEAFRNVDYQIPLEAARYCQNHETPSLIIISAMGANANSSIFYNKVKGEMENDILDIKHSNTYFVQPALLDSDREETRTGERIAIAIFKVLNKILVGPLKKYQSIKPATIAAAMRKLANEGYHKPRISSDELKALAKSV